MLPLSRGETGEVLNLLKLILLTGDLCHRHQRYLMGQRANAVWKGGPIL